MLWWIAGGLYGLIAVLLARTLWVNVDDVDIEDDLKRPLYGAIVLTALLWPVSVSCVLVIKAGKKLSGNKAE